jgi:DNA polymerase-1
MTPFEFDIAYQRPVFYMMRRGIRVDLEKRREQSETYHADWDKWQKLLNEVAAHPVNVSSPPQMKKLLYDELGLPKRSQKKKVTTNEDAIRASMAYAEGKAKDSKKADTKAKWTRAFIACKLILKVREARKLISSYLDVPLDTDARARCTMSVGGAENFRFTHSKTLWGTGLNLATVPHKLRISFIADDGYELAEFDLNRGESWVYTFLSEDPELIRIHTGGLDFHAETASAIQSAFGGKNLTPEEIRSLAKTGDAFGYRIRYLGKKVNHASAYRMGPFRAAEVVNEESDDTGIVVTPTQMKVAQGLWHQKYIGMGGWWGDVDEKITTRRELRNVYGRRRQFFGFTSDHLLKEATSWEPSSTSVEYINRGMLKVYDELVAPGAYGLELLHQNHDSILVQYKKEHRDEVLPEIKERLLSTIVINGHELTIPVEGSVGMNWGDYHEEDNPEGLREAA